MLAAGAISAGSSLLGGILGNSAASKAAAAQAAAGKAASGLAGAAGQAAGVAQSGQIAAENANAAPYTTLGSGTAGELGGLLAPGGALTQGYQSFSAPTGVTEQNDPGYAFRLQQGQNALQNSAAARGGLLSTGTAKSLADYNQNAASAEYGNVYNRALQTYGTNQQNFNTNNTNLYNRLYGTTALGSQAASALNNVTQSGTQNLTGDLLSTAQTQGNDIMGIGNATAGGIVGGSNALTGGLSAAGNALGQGVSLAKLLGAQNSSNTSYAQQMPYNPSTAIPLWGQG